MKTPFYKQETIWTCGAAAARMVFASFGIIKSEKQIVRLLGTNKKTGTPNKLFPKLFEQYGFNYSVNRYSSIKKLEEFYKKKYKIIIRYFHPTEKSGHFAVLKKIDIKNIYLLDPISGPNHYYSINYFETLWNKIDPKLDKEKRWFIAVKSPNP